MFFDFYGENLFARTWGSSVARSARCSATAVPSARERNIARIFGADRSYSVLNGTSASNRAIMSACVGDEEIALCDPVSQVDRAGPGDHRRYPGLPGPDRNRYGIIGPIPPQQLEPKAIAKSSPTIRWRRPPAASAPCTRC